MPAQKSEHKSEQIFYQIQIFFTKFLRKFQKKIPKTNQCRYIGGHFIVRDRLFGAVIAGVPLYRVPLYRG